MTEYYDTTKYSQQDELEKHELAGTFVCKVKVCKLGLNDKNEKTIVIGFIIGESIHWQTLTLNDRWGWLADKTLRQMGLSELQRKNPKPEMIVGKEYEIELEQNGQYLKLKSVRPMTTKAPAPARDKDVPF